MGRKKREVKRGILVSFGGQGGKEKGGELNLRGGKGSSVLIYH